MKEPTDHIAMEALQDYLEGLLPREGRERIARHLADCPGCSSTLEEWRGVFAALGGLPPVEPGPAFRGHLLTRIRSMPDPLTQALAELPRLRPAPDFSRRVMRELGVRERASNPGRTALRDHLSRLLGSVVPSTRRGWLLAGGLALTPAVGFILLVVALLSHPLLNPDEWILFLARQSVVLARAGSLHAANLLLESTPGILLQAVVRFLVSTPAAAAAWLSAAWLATGTAGWILYRNLIVDPQGSRPHAQLR